jgi:hypothetical protein
MLYRTASHIEHRAETDIARLIASINVCNTVYLRNCCFAELFKYIENLEIISIKYYDI